VSPRNLEFGVIAINFGRESPERTEELRLRVEAVLADATATLERLGVAHAIGEARMRSQTDELREALIGSVSHELRTPLASILGAATVLSAAPALKNEKKLKALAHDVRDEAERLNNDIQNLLDASRISSGGIKPRTEWAEPADIIDSAIARCSRRLAGHRLVLDLGADLPLVHGDPVLLQQALVQVLDNAAKYSSPGTQITVKERNDPGRTGADLGTFCPQRAPHRDHQRFRPRPVDRQCLHCRQWRHDQCRQRRPRPGQHGDDGTPGDATRSPADGKRRR
jgi:two-component system sensor histidine kinase KdpD